MIDEAKDKSTYIIYNHILTSIKSNINFIRSVLISNIKNRLRNGRINR